MSPEDLSKEVVRDIKDRLETAGTSLEAVLTAAIKTQVHYKDPAEFNPDDFTLD